MSSQAATPRPLWKSVILVLTSFPFLLAARIAWQVDPGIWWCLLFWTMALADEPIRWAEMRRRRRVLYGLATLGAIGNAVATIANGGYMPVLGKSEATSVWVPLTEASRMQWLCDIYGGASLGDFFIAAALLGLFVNWSCEKLPRWHALALEPEPPIIGKRLPGLGVG